MSGETDTYTVTHWGCRLPSGVIRWSRDSMAGVEELTEAEAREDVKQTGGTLVTRQQTTTITTTPWTMAGKGAQDV